ncbi:MAG: hypothetical protein IMZ53_06055 [Thermoplasmata archaeon]|nr:hypothetical protein [Thermoplasmata archaeon]
MQNIDLRPLFDSGEYDFGFIDGLIKTYRKTYYRIPEFWSLVEKCFKHVVKFKTERIALGMDIDNGLKITQGVGTLLYSRLTFWNNGGTVNLQLPSGRVLYYRHSRIDNENSIRWQWGNLWGGSITENIVQAVARDLLGYWILEFEKRGLPVVLHTHDEIVALITDNPCNYIGHAMANILMSRGPEWSKGLPLAAEGVIASVYRK